MRRILARLAPLFLALRDASSTDPEAAQVWAQTSERRAANLRLLATGQLRDNLDPGWSPQHHQDWLANSWRRLSLADN
jgi:hypothetical protein